MVLAAAAAERAQVAWADRAQAVWPAAVAQHQFLVAWPRAPAAVDRAAMALRLLAADRADQDDRSVDLAPIWLRSPTT
jgi:hypothetical protein